MAASIHPEGADGAGKELKESKEAAQKATDKYLSIFNSISEGFCIYELIYDNEKVVDLRWMEVNPAYERQTGLTDVIGKLHSELSPGTEDYWFENFDQVAKTGQAAQLEQWHEPTGRWYSTFSSRVGGENSRQVAVVFNDITGRKQVEQRQEFLIKLSDALREFDDPIALQQTAMKLLVEHLDVTRAAYFELEKDGNTIVLSACRERNAGSFPRRAQLSDFPADLASETRLGHTLSIQDTEQEERPEPERRIYRSIGVRAWAAVPVVKSGKLLAIMGVHSKTPRRWTRIELELLEGVAERTWLATERARDQARMRDSEKRLRLAVEAAEMATWEWDLIKNQIIWNERHFRILGLAPQSGYVTPEKFFEHVHPDEKERLDSELRVALAGGPDFDTEFRAVLRDGSERWMSGFGRVMEKLGNQPLTMSGVMFDITARRQAEMDLHRIRDRQDAVLKSAADYAIVTYDLNLRVHDWNAGAEYMMGYSEQEIVGQPVEIFFVPEDRAKGAPEFESSKAIQEGRAENERWHLRKDGSRFYGSGVTSPLRDEAGNVIGLLKVMRDLTVQKEAEMALKRADRQKDEFLAMLAHELRNPLSTVRNGLSILKITHQADSGVSEIVGMMDNQTAHLIRMIDDLLDVSRVTQGKIELKLERVDVGNLIEHTVAAVGPQFKARQKVLHVPHAFPKLFVQGDVTRLSQVITNLLTNGLRYTGDDGEVWLNLAYQDSEAVISVKDNGIGLSAEQQTSVFELFVQGDNSLARSQGGLGIGLTLVRRLVEMHGGRVEARSAGFGQGSEFRVHLPLLHSPEQEKSLSGDPLTPAPFSSRILLIDDLEDLAKLTATLLRMKGYHVDIRSSGRSGIEGVETLRPSVVLCDIGMPDLDGYETAQLIRQGSWGRQVALIALSGYGQEEDKRRAKEAGFDGHLTKPVSIEELESLITKLRDS